MNSTADLNVIFNPLDNVEKTLHVHSSDESLVTVTQKLDDDNNPTPVLQLTGLKEGMAVITCYSDDLKGYAGGIDNPISCIVTITKRVFRQQILRPHQRVIRQSRWYNTVGHQSLHRKIHRIRV